MMALSIRGCFGFHIIFEEPLSQERLSFSRAYFIHREGEGVFYTSKKVGLANEDVVELLRY